MRESLLKSALFIGVPRVRLSYLAPFSITYFIQVILSMSGLMEVFEDDVKINLRSESLRYSDSPPEILNQNNIDLSRTEWALLIRTATPENIESIKARGRRLWDSVYEPHADKLHSKLHSYHPDFIGMCRRSPFTPTFFFQFIVNRRKVLPRFGHSGPIFWNQLLIFRSNLAFIIQSYGALFAPLPGKNEQGNLSRALGSVAAVACLRAEGGVGPQLTSHIYGLLKARYEEDQSVEEKWLSSEEGAEWVLRTVDSVLDVVKPDVDDVSRAKL